MALPLLIIPAGGISVVTSLRLAPKLFAPFETAWAWGAKLAAANALSALEVAALMGLSPSNAQPLLPAHLPQKARALGRRMAFPAEQIEHAFLGGALKSLHPMMCEHLRLCPICARLGYHFVIHQMLPFVCCPLHDVRLREHCARCATHVAYDLGKSKVQGPINCPTCSAPQLPVTRGGYPITGTMPAVTFVTVARWLMFLQRRSRDLSLLNAAIGANRLSMPAFQDEAIRAIRPARSVLDSAATSRRLWSDDAEHQCLAALYWQHVNALWRQCCTPSRRWYRRMLKGDTSGLAPTARILAFVYWRMTWQGCTNPYLLSRGRGLPLYGIAAWEARQPAIEEDDLDVALVAFGTTLDTSWNDWIECVDLLGITELERRTWRLRARPEAYIPLAQKQRKRTTNNFAQLL